MKIFLFTFFLFLSSYCLFGQSHGYIIIGSDTANYIIDVKKSSHGNMILFRREHQVDMSEVTAPNADEAGVPGKWKYISIKLPNENAKVWAQCFFEGEYKLLKFKSEYYILSPTDTLKLTSPNNGTVKQKFRGQLVALLAEKLDYNYNQLAYNSESLVRPLIELHQRDGLSYVDYNHYSNTVKTTVVFADFADVKGMYYSSSLIKINPAGNSFALGVNRCLSYPDFSKRLTFIAGGKVNIYLFDQYFKTETSYGSVFTDFSNTFYAAGLQGLIAYRIFDKPEIKLEIQAGIELKKFWGPDSRGRFEIEYNNIVQTSFYDVSVSNALQMSQIDKLIVGFPKFSKAMQMGIGGSIPIGKSLEEENVFVVDRSFNISMYYQF